MLNREITEENQTNSMIAGISLHESEQHKQIKDLKGELSKTRDEILELREQSSEKNAKPHSGHQTQRKQCQR